MTAPHQLHPLTQWVLARMDCPDYDISIFPREPEDAECADAWRIEIWSTPIVDLDTSIALVALLAELEAYPPRSSSLFTLETRNNTFSDMDLAALTDEMSRLRIAAAPSSQLPADDAQVRLTALQAALAQVGSAHGQLRMRAALDAAWAGR